MKKVKRTTTSTSRMLSREIKEDTLRELNESSDRGDNPLYLEDLYQELHHTRDEYIRGSIRSNY